MVCIVPCVCVVPCVLHVHQCEWMNRGGATKDKVGGAGHTTALLFVFFPFFCIIIPLLSLCLSPLIIVRSHFWLSSLYFVSLFHLFIHSQFPLFVLAVCFFQKAQWSHCFSHYFYSHWGYKWTKSYSSSHQPIKEMPGACERRQQTHTQQAVPGTV